MMSHLRIAIPAFVILLITGLGPPLPAHGQGQAAVEVPDSVRSILGEAEIEQYRKRRLSVIVEGRSVDSYDSFRNSSEGVQWRRWDAVQGSEEISEVAFFEQVGNYNKAANARAYHSSARNLIYSGGGMALLGVGFMVVAENSDALLSDPGNASRSLTIAGAIVSGIGVSLSVSGLLKLRKNWESFGIAYDLSKEYNRDLVRKLRDGELEANR